MDYFAGSAGTTSGAGAGVTSAAGATGTTTSGAGVAGTTTSAAGAGGTTTSTAGASSFFEQAVKAIANRDASSRDFVMMIFQ